MPNSGRNDGARRHPADASQREQVTRPCRVLIVEDVPATAKWLSMIVTSLGHAVSVVYDGEQALAAAPTFQPHAVLLDIALPGMDGCAVAQAIRQMPECAQTRLIALTALAEHEHILEAGFDFYMPKPVDVNRLRRLLSEISCGE